jgi:hypothetical protein
LISNVVMGVNMTKKTLVKEPYFVEVRIAKRTQITEGTPIPFIGDIEKRGG